MIEAHHTQMTFSDTGAIIPPLEAQVLVDDKLLQEELQAIETLQFISIGSTHIVFGPAREL
jgi:hypothetical protein